MAQLRMAEQETSAEPEKEESGEKANPSLDAKWTEDVAGSDEFQGKKQEAILEKIEKEVKIADDVKGETKWNSVSRVLLTKIFFAGYKWSKRNLRCSRISFYLVLSLSKVLFVLNGDLFYFYGIVWLSSVPTLM